MFIAKCLSSFHRGQRKVIPRFNRSSFASREEEERRRHWRCSGKQSDFHWVSNRQRGACKKHSCPVDLKGGKGEGDNVTSGRVTLSQAERKRERERKAGNPQGRLTHRMQSAPWRDARKKRGVLFRWDKLSRFSLSLRESREQVAWENWSYVNTLFVLTIVTIHTMTPCTFTNSDLDIIDDLDELLATICTDSLPQITADEVDDFFSSFNPVVQVGACETDKDTEKQTCKRISMLWLRKRSRDVLKCHNYSKVLEDNSDFENQPTEPVRRSVKRSSSKMISLLKKNSSARRSRTFKRN